MAPFTGMLGILIWLIQKASESFVLQMSLCLIFLQTEFHICWDFGDLALGSLSSKFLVQRGYQGTIHVRVPAGHTDIAFILKEEAALGNFL
ncbi:hypothetical protein N7478_002349 [Penicillium angulare]|uniref:uncharacterized protein n=1 Tax=Penicillium angulare TaxID=116970 RepID=UPI00254175E9|nr:uncharacterized protein N7478_002349 [Penicillium angulare]KAJ5286663.1 hypothetical protein N7478_002349 [Penicillium angulare]